MSTHGRPKGEYRSAQHEGTLMSLHGLATVMAEAPGAASDAALQVVAVDAAFIVVDKPAGLLAVPGRGEAKRDCLAARVQAAWPDALVVHRLDQATSGLLLFARGTEAQRALSRAFAARTVGKRYVAVVAGRLAPERGSIDAPLGADWPRRPRQQVDREHGKPSVTHWRVLGHDGEHGTTRVELEPVTGRSHQLRVHLQSIGHPILGDALYTPQAVCDESLRLLLHASELAFAHPLGGQPLRFVSPVPF